MSVPFSRRSTAAMVIGVAMLAVAGPAAAQIRPPGADTAPAPADQGRQFGDWRRQCDPPRNGRPETCFILQKLVNKDNNQVIMTVAVAYLGEKQIPAVVLTVPLGVFLPPGLNFAIADAPPVKVVVETCTEQGCRGGTPLSDEMLAAMRKGTKAEVTVVIQPPDGKRRTLNLPISLNGFTAGFASLKKN